LIQVASLFSHGLNEKPVMNGFILTSVTCALAQVLPCSQLIFPSKTWFSWNLFEFSAAEIT
jgi:hypothetical protein